MKFRQMLAGTACAALFAVGLAGSAAAEVDTVNMAEQFGLLYLPLNVVMERELIQKHATAMGLKAPEVKMFKISGGANINKALLAGEIDFGAHGIGPALKLWGRSEGRFKLAVNTTYMPLKLLTNDPKIKTVEDYLNVEDHKIATPAAKVSIQAVTLQMYAQDKWGQPDKLDHLVVSMKHPTAMAALVSGGQAVKSHFATLPFSYQELQSGKVHQVISSYEILGGEHSVVGLSAPVTFKEKNPKTYAAVVAAYNEAFEWINANKGEAAEIFIRQTGSKLPKDQIHAMVTNSDEIGYSALPKHTMKYATFLHKIGDIPEAKSWKDYFFDNNHKLDGS